MRIEFEVTPIIVTGFEITRILDSENAEAIE